MGYDLNRFKGHINRHVICSICFYVIEDPAQVPICEHVFCRKCITAWIEKYGICPQDRTCAKVDDLEDVSLFMGLLLGQQRISCDFAFNGCKQYVALNALAGHVKWCPFRPTSLLGESAIEPIAMVKETKSSLTTKLRENEETLKAVIDDNFITKQKLEEKEGRVLELEKANCDLREEIAELRREASAAGVPLKTTSRRESAYCPLGLKLEEEEKTTIKLLNLPFQATVVDVYNLMKQFGETVEIYVEMDVFGCGSFSFVTFKTRQEAIRAMDGIKGRVFGHLVVAVEWAKRQPYNSGSPDYPEHRYIRAKMNTRVSRNCRADKDRWL